MTRPRIFEDPQSGAPMLTGAPWPHGHANNVLDALRRTEKAAYLTMLQNWQTSGFLAGTPVLSVSCYDASLGIWATAVNPGSTLSVSLSDTSMNGLGVGTTVPSTTSGASCSASSDQGCMVYGLTPTGSTASKILQSFDGVTWALRTIGAANTRPVAHVRWSKANARFVALVNPGEAYTSPDGVTWSAQTVPGGLAAVTWTGLAISNTGVCVASANGTTTYMTSADGGVTWVQRTGPAAGSPSDFITSAPGIIAYSTGLNSFAWNTSHVSTDGVSWSTMTAAPRFTATGKTKLIGMGPTFLALTTEIGGTGGNMIAEVAYDQVNPSAWSVANSFSMPDGSSTYSRHYGFSDNQILIHFAQSAGNVRFNTLSLGY